ncbi:MnmC family methyltransferase [Helicobacter mesocricetorum]|uniref:MnmC family methyltransferase n=1 Tax=Helicobacter mesocricetorum TaxID=87012 RepID=UPI000CF0F121|nr:MnmC family methyltransferase [Helicobacter mesocricetorum]
MLGILTQDLSFTLFNQHFGEHYHNLRDGALKETLHKHIYPSFAYSSYKDSLKVLDICFGLGYNTFALISYAKERGYKGVLEIHSPEIDRGLLLSLESYKYPKSLDKQILKKLITQQYYEEEKLKVFLHLGEAREILTHLKGDFDIVFQDAFSPKKNKMLWTYEYFKRLFEMTSEDCIITTYSQNSSMLYGAFLAGFIPYLLRQKEVRDSIVFTKIVNPCIAIANVLGIVAVDIPHKISLNKNLKALYDEEINEKSKQ